MTFLSGTSKLLSGTLKRDILQWVKPHRRFLFMENISFFLLRHYLGSSGGPETSCVGQDGIIPLEISQPQPSESPQ